MTIAFDAVSPDTSSTGNVSTLTSGSMTVAGSQRIMIGAIGCGAGTPTTHTGMKWGGSGGVAMTQISTSLNVGANGRMSMWRLLAPALGASTVYGLWGAVQDESAIAGVSYTGVDQTTPLGTAVTTTGTINGIPSGSATINVTTVAGDLVVAVFWVLDLNGNAPLMTPSGGATGRYDIEGAQLGSEGMQITELVASGTTTTMSCTIAATTGNLNATWGVIAVPLKTASAAAGTTPISRESRGSSGGMGPALNGGMSARSRLHIPNRKIYLPAYARQSHEMRAA